METKKTQKRGDWHTYGPTYPKDFIPDTGIPSGWHDAVRRRSGSMLFIHADKDVMVCLSATPPGYGEDGQGGVIVQVSGRATQRDIESVRKLASESFMKWFEDEGYILPTVDVTAKVVNLAAYRRARSST